MQMRRGLDSAKSSSSLRRQKTLRRNSSMSCGDLHQISELFAQTCSEHGSKSATLRFTRENLPKSEKKRKFSFKKWLKLGKHGKTQSSADMTPKKSSKMRLTCALSKSNVLEQLPKTPMLRTREELITSGLVIWEEGWEEFAFDTEANFTANAKIYTANPY